MGFGLLLCGYFVLTFMSFGMGEYAFAAYLIGGMITFSAAVRLKDYCPRFAWTAIAAAAYILLAVYHGAVFLDTLFLWGAFSTDGALPAVVSAIQFAVELAFHITFLWSVAELSGSLALGKIKARAIRNLVFVSVWGVGQVILLIFPALATFERGAVTQLLLLLLLVCYFLNAWLLYSCYQYICPAGEELGKPSKPSRFAFVNRLNAKFDEKAERALRESLEYQAERQQKKESRNQQRKKRRK